jgi:hypothetical protein
MDRRGVFMRRTTYYSDRGKSTVYRRDEEVNNAIMEGAQPAHYQLDDEANKVHMDGKKESRLDNRGIQPNAKQQGAKEGENVMKGSLLRGRLLLIQDTINLVGFG